MRALLPVYCRPLGYFIIALALFLPFIFLLWGKVTDANLLFYKECSKLLMMMGALMIIFALTKNENKEIEQVRNKATRNAIFLTVLFIFGGMLYRVAQGDLLSVDSSSFLIFLKRILFSIPPLQYKKKRPQRTLDVVPPLFTQNCALIF